jgi:hypothetical protein
MALAASRTVANASGSRSSSFSPSASRARNLTVCAESSSSDIAWSDGSNEAILARIGLSDLT